MRRIASPVLRVPSPIKSIRGGGPPGSKGARSHLTRPVTSYVPPPVDVVPSEANVCHVPPPVAAPDVPPPPPGATKVPEPVSVICEPSFAFADAMPPGLAVNGATKLTLMMSQRTCWAWPMATELVDAIHNSVTPIPKSHRFSILIATSPFINWLLTFQSRFTHMGSE